MSIFLIIVSIVAFVVTIFFYAVNKWMAEKDESTKVYMTKKRAAIIIVLAIVLFVFSLSFDFVPTGYTGIRVTFGKVSEQPVPTGFTWKIPFVHHIKTVNNKQQAKYISGQIWSESSDRTAMYYDGVAITYTINPAKSVWIYSNVTNYEDNLILQSDVTSAVKSVSKTLNSTEVTNRGIVEPKVMEALQQIFDSKYGKDTITIYKISITNADFEDSYNKAIADKQTAQIAYEQQQITNQRAIEQAEAEAKVKETNANADAKAKLIQAQADADATLVKAEAEAKANAKISASLTDNILRKQYYESWNGVLPNTILGDGTNALVDISK